MKKLLVSALFCSVCVLAFGGGTKKSNGNTSDSLDKIMKRGTLKVGLSTFRPWAMINEHNELFGFEVDVAKEVAKSMGVDLELINVEWSGIIPALQTGQFDVIIGGMGITEDRLKVIDFTEPYEYAGQSLAINSQVGVEVTSMESLNNKEVIIAMRTGTTAAPVATELFPEARQKFFAREDEMVQEVLNGNATGFISSSPLPMTEALANPDVLSVPEWGKLLTKEPIGFGLKKGQGSLKNYFNEWIAEKWGDGFLEERYSYWFESQEWLQAGETQ